MCHFTTCTVTHLAYHTYRVTCHLDIIYTRNILAMRVRYYSRLFYLRVVLFILVYLTRESVTCSSTSADAVTVMEDYHCTQCLSVFISVLKTRFTSPNTLDTSSSNTSTSITQCKVCKISIGARAARAALNNSYFIYY